MSKGRLKRDFFEIYLTTFSESVISEIQKQWGSPFLRNCSKFQLHFKNGAKKWEKVFCFSDKFLWIGILKFSLLRTGYFSSVTNMLISSPKIWHVYKKNFFENNFVSNDQWIWSMCSDADFNSAWARLPDCLSKHPLKQDFLDIYLTTFSDSVTSKIQNEWGSCFFFKILKIQSRFQKCCKKFRRSFCFWDNCIWIGIVKFSLLKTGYFSSLANVLTSSPKICHVNKRDFFENNFVGSDQWIW